MRVTMINSGLPVPPKLGGPIARTVYETALGLDGFDLTVISPWDEALEGLPAAPDVFFHVDVLREAKRAGRVLGHDRSAWQLGFYCGVVRLLHRLDPDVIQVHNGPWMAPGLRRIFPGKQLVLYLHNHFEGPTFSRAVRAADRVVVVSRSMLPHVARQGAGCLEKTTVIYNSIDTQVWRPGLKQHPETRRIRRTYGLQRGKAVVFVGRTVAEKGIAHLIDAVGLLKAQIPDVRLLVVGGSAHGTGQSRPFWEQLQRRARRLGDTVQFAGSVDPLQTPFFYAAADVVAAPSVWAEPFGKVVVEAMACGVPVVASRRGAIPELIEDGVHGVLVDDPTDAHALADCIAGVLCDAALGNRLRRAARKQASTHFSTSVRLGRVRSFFEGLDLGRKPVRLPRRGFRIAMVNSQWLPVPPVQGGPVAETICDTALAIRDPEHVVISPWHDALAGYKAPPGVFYHVDKQAQMARLQPFFDAQMFDSSSRDRFAYAQGVIDLLHDLDPDVIQVHNAPWLIPAVARVFPDKTRVLYMHNVPNPSEKRVAEALRAADHLVVVSRFLADFYASHFPGCAPRVTVIDNCVNPEVWRPGLRGASKTRALRRQYGLGPGKTVLFVGRVHPQKGVAYLLAAMDLVHRQVPDARLLVAGSSFARDTGQTAFYRRLLDRSKTMSAPVVFAGYVDHLTTPYLYALADVVVAPSMHSEGMPKVVLEAMACGMPVVATRCGGILEVIDHGENGILVDDAQDVEALADAIVGVLQTKGRILGRKARAKVVEAFHPAVRFSRVQAFCQVLKNGR